jgi:hypothetical protein
LESRTSATFAERTWSSGPDARAAACSPGSRAIDQDVRSILQQPLAVYEIELGQLERARPDIIVTQDLCDVWLAGSRDISGMWMPELIERAGGTRSGRPRATPPRR